MESITESVVETEDGFPLAVQVGGVPDAPPLLLLPGREGSHHWWDGVREGLDGHFRTITFDYRGTGGSRGPVGDWTTAGFARDAAAVVDSLGIDEFGVYATSMGGRVASWLAVQQRGRLSALVLACTSPGLPYGYGSALALRLAIQRATTAERVAIMHDLFYTPAWPGKPDANNPRFGDPTMSSAEHGAQRKASERHDVWDSLPLIDAPTLVLHGTDDRLTPPGNARLFGEQIQGAKVVMFEGGRHGFFQEFADEVTPLVIDFAATA